MASRAAALRSLRVLNGAVQAVQPVLLEEFGRPRIDFSRAEVASLSLLEEATQPPPHVGVDPRELVHGIPGAEVMTPTAKHGVQVADQHPHILDPVPAWSGQ